MKPPIYESFFDYCPHIGDNVEIDVKFIYVLISGTLASNYKRCNFTCPVSNCDLNGENDCPLFRSVPTAIVR